MNSDYNFPNAAGYKGGDLLDFLREAKSVHDILEAADELKRRQHLDENPHETQAYAARNFVEQNKFDPDDVTKLKDRHEDDWSAGDGVDIFFNDDSRIIITWLEDEPGDYFPVTTIFTPNGLEIDAWGHAS